MLQKGDTVVNRGTSTAWCVVKINSDGTLAVERTDQRTGRLLQRRITRPEFYLKRDP